MKKATLLLTLLIPVFTFCQIINIPDDYPTIQQGIDAASIGDTVLVDTGTYVENINFNGKAITVASHYLIDVDSTIIYNTIIDGSNPSDPDFGSVVTFDSDTDTSSCLYGFTVTAGSGTKVPFIFPLVSGGGVLFSNAGGKLISNIIINNECILDTLDGIALGGGIGGGPPGFFHNIVIRENLIENNLAWTKGPSTEWNTGWAEGGGVYLCYDAILERNLIKSNTCRSENGISVGGGVRMIADPGVNIFQILVILKGNVISNNASKSLTSDALAGGLSCSGANTIIENNIIANNIIESQDYCQGAGLYFDLIDSYYARVYNNHIFENSYFSGSSFGGAIGLFRSHDVEVSNNLIENNSAERGGGISINACEPKLITNNTLLNNSASLEGGAFYIYESSVVEILNSILRNDSANGVLNEIYKQNSSILTVQYSNIMGTWIGEGNIDQDPIFVNSGDHPFQINDNSPCIDAGTPDTTGLNLPEYDLAGEIRINNDRVDMGAYEWNTFVGAEEFEVEISIFEVDCYPNPFSVSTTFSYELLQPSTAHLSIFNHFGQRVDFIQQNQSVGKQQITWDASSKPSGVYYFRLRAGEQVASGKIVKLK